jgi:hypothetical protein
MDTVMGIVRWVMDNMEVVFGILFAAHALALAIVNVTPTPADDRILGVIYRAVEWLAGVFTRTSKELPGEREEVVEVEMDEDL